MIIDLGGYYLNRKKEVIGPIKHSSPNQASAGYPFYSEGRSYTRDGQFYPHENSDEDLVKDHYFELGKLYIDHNLMLVQCREITKDSSGNRVIKFRKMYDKTEYYRDIKGTGEFVRMADSKISEVAPSTPPDPDYQYSDKPSAIPNEWYNNTPTLVLPPVPTYSVLGQNVSSTEVLGSSLVQIPFEALDELGKIFAEGQVKYGRDNWKSNPTKEYQEERCNHAIRHLMLWANGDRSENHLAKVMWFCVTQIWTEKNVNSKT